MTANTGIMIRKIGRIGKVPPGRPGRRNLMTRVARKAFVLVGRMKEHRILYRRGARRLPTSLRDAESDCAGSNDYCENGSGCHQARLQFWSALTSQRFEKRRQVAALQNLIGCKKAKGAQQSRISLSDLCRLIR